ncbi:hypothetical protein ACVWXL_009318 [Bradyrhizobium sp. GM22.5]
MLSLRNFLVTLLNILVSYPNGFAAMAELKRDTRPFSPLAVGVG